MKCWGDYLCTRERERKKQEDGGIWIMTSICTIHWTLCGWWNQWVRARWDGGEFKDGDSFPWWWRTKYLRNADKRQPDCKAVQAEDTCLLKVSCLSTDSSIQLYRFNIFKPVFLLELKQHDIGTWLIGGSRVLKRVVESFLITCHPTFDLSRTSLKRFTPAPVGICLKMNLNCCHWDSKIADGITRDSARGWTLSGIFCARGVTRCVKLGKVTRGFLHFMHESLYCIAQERVTARYNASVCTQWVIPDA